MAVTFTIEDVSDLCHSRAHLEKGLRDIEKDAQGRMKLSDECRTPRGKNFARSDDFDRLYTAYKVICKNAPELCDKIAARIAERAELAVAEGASGPARLLATSKEAIVRARNRRAEWAAQLEDYATLSEEHTPARAAAEPLAPATPIGARKLPAAMQARLAAVSARKTQRAAAAPTRVPVSALVPAATVPVASKREVVRPPGALFRSSRRAESERE